MQTTELRAIAEQLVDETFFGVFLHEEMSDPEKCFVLEILQADIRVQIEAMVNEDPPDPLETAEACDDDADGEEES